MTAEEFRNAIGGIEEDANRTFRSHCGNQIGANFWAAIFNERAKSLINLTHRDLTAKVAILLE